MGVLMCVSSLLALAGCWPGVLPQVYPRAVVFILDSKHAMKGRAMEEARRAVVGALKRLSPHDSFAVVGLDFELLVHSETLEPATPENVKAASKFYLQAYEAHQARTVLAPLQLVSPLVAFPYLSLNLKSLP